MANEVQSVPRVQPLRIVVDAVMYGAVGAGCWLFAHAIAEWLRFTRVRIADWAIVVGMPDRLRDEPLGIGIGCIVWIAVSVCMAVVCALLCRRMPTEAWTGMVGGVGAFLLVYCAVFPWNVPKYALWRMDAATWSTEACLLILWGTFVVYSVQMRTFIHGRQTSGA
jgi:hypothetical protein